MADSVSLRQWYQRPSSAKLAGVKHGMYHPRLPSLRRMDMDTTTHKLPTEHSRTSTPCTLSDFMDVKSTQISKRQPLHCKNVLRENTKTAMRYSQPLSTQNHVQNWKNIFARLDPHHGQTDAVKELEVSGLATRSKPPAITQSWQYSRPSSAVYQPHQQRPMAATL